MANGWEDDWGRGRDRDADWYEEQRIASIEGHSARHSPSTTIPDVSDIGTLNELRVESEAAGPVGEHQS